MHKIISVLPLGILWTPVPYKKWSSQRQWKWFRFSTSAGAWPPLVPANNDKTSRQSIDNAVVEVLNFSQCVESNFDKIANAINKDFDG